MDPTTIEVCWTIMKQYIKVSDRATAAEHLVTEISEHGILDEDLALLKDVDQYLEHAISEIEPEADPDYDED